MSLRESEANVESAPPRPFTLVAELTHRCPLKCPYCSNPRELHAASAELTTDEWRRVLRQAEGLGVVQLHLTGGEPLVRDDLEAIAAEARALGFYTNLVTSGVPLSRERLFALRDAGVDAVQLSFQDAHAESADEIAGTRAHARKLEVARWVREAELPLTVNVVLHARNIDHTAELIALAEELGADRVELANAQYHAWALENRDALLPTREQIDGAHRVAIMAKARLRGTMEVLFVKPDYFSEKPRACMDGWARRFVHVQPNGTVLPCHAATSIAGMRFESAREKPMSWIWEQSPSFNAFRGDAWMKEPCVSCARKDVDFGGCRCQAFALTGDARAADPACALSANHALVARAHETRAPKRFLHRGR